MTTWYLLSPWIVQSHSREVSRGWKVLQSEGKMLQDERKIL